MTNGHFKNLAECRTRPKVHPMGKRQRSWIGRSKQGRKI